MAKTAVYTAFVHLVAGEFEIDRLTGRYGQQDIARVAAWGWLNGVDVDDQELGRRAAQALEDEILRLGPENVGAFIGEPVQVTGFGRTGEWFAQTFYDVEPDITVMGEVRGVGAILAGYS